MPVWAPKRSGRILGPDGQDARTPPKPKDPEWWKDFRSGGLQVIEIAKQKFRLAQVGTNGLQLVYRGGDPDWQTRIGLNTLHMINGHWFKVIKKVDQGVLLEYRHPTKKRKGK